jgi:hypothetical protein
VEILHSLRPKEVKDCKLLKYEQLNMQTGKDTESKAEKYGKKTLRKTEVRKIWE